MGYGIYTNTAEGGYKGLKIGSYGCQPFLSGLFIAAYAADRRPEANRVTAWADNLYTRNGPIISPDAPRTERNRPGTAQALIDYDDGLDEGNSYVCALDDTIELGCKFKAPTDPDLLAVLAFHRTVNAMSLPQTIAAADAATMAPVLRSLLPRLAKSQWYETCVEVVEVLEAAVAAGTEVSCG